MEKTAWEALINTQGLWFPNPYHALGLLQEYIKKEKEAPWSCPRPTVLQLYELRQGIFFFFLISPVILKQKTHKPVFSDLSTPAGQKEPRNIYST